MSLVPVIRTASSLAARPLGAIAISLATVLGFSALLGMVFLPYELVQLADGTPSTIIDHHAMADGQRAILLTKWRQPGAAGRICRRVALYDWAVGGSTRVLIPESYNPYVSTIDGSGSRLFVGTMDQRILAVSLRADEQPVLLGTYQGGALRELHASPDGAVVVAGGTAGLIAWNSAAGNSCWSRPDLGDVRLTIDPLSSCLLVNTTDGRILELEFSAGRTLQLIGTYARFAAGLAVSSDGRRIARIGNDGCLELIDRTTGNFVWPEIVASRRAGYAPRALAFSPCGRVLVASDALDPSCLLVWSVATGQRIGELRGHHEPVMGLEFATGGRLHSWGVDGTVCTWSGRADGTIDGVPLVRSPAIVQPGILAETSSARWTTANRFKLDRWR